MSEERAIYLTGLAAEVADYYERRGLVWPSRTEALRWALCEIGECYELLFARQGGWVRNNPGAHIGWDARAFAEELGDVLMMLVVAGADVGGDSGASDTADALDCAAHWITTSQLVQGRFCSHAASAILAAGRCEGVDPVAALRAKMARKLAEAGR